MSQVRMLAGFDQLGRRLGRSTPTGVGVVAGHVEGSYGEYLPKYDDAALSGVAIFGRSGQSRVYQHATATAKVIYGSRGLAPGISEVHCFAINDFLGSGFLNVGSREPPSSDGIRLFNHSWISRNLSSIGDILQRTDCVINTHGMIMVVGVDNGSSSKVPALLASAYNVIAVGQWDGDSSGDYTKYATPGRCKPDVVGPGHLTSFATPVVTAIVARLLEAIERDLSEDLRPKARRSEVIKAILLAGAEKPLGWKQDDDKPLDEHFGAGRANVDRSYTILTAGTPNSGHILKRYGWNSADLHAGPTHTYRFDVAEDLGGTSLVLVWHRRILAAPVEDRAMMWKYRLTQPRLADFDLKLIRLDDEIAASASPIDNVEHIYLKSLERGSYDIVVQRKDNLNEAWNYAIAWLSEQPRPSVP